MLVKLAPDDIKSKKATSLSLSFLPALINKPLSLPWLITIDAPVLSESLPAWNLATRL